MHDRAEAKPLLASQTPLVSESVGESTEEEAQERVPIELCINSKLILRSCVEMAQNGTRKALRSELLCEQYPGPQMAIERWI